MPAVFNPTSWTPVVLAWSFLLLFPFSHSSELPVFIMAILGGVLIWMLREDLARQRLLKLSTWLLLFWVVNALIQAAVGYNLLGYAYPERLNGLFGPHNWKLGLSLAMLSPIVWEYVSRHGAKWQLALAWLGTAAVVLLVSNRESWMVFAIATMLWSWVYARRLDFHPAKLLVPIVLVAVVAGVGAYQVNSKFAQRVDQSSAVLDGSYESLNNASSYRLHLWKYAVIVLENHPINGAGVRSYRYAYSRYADEGDPYVSADGIGMFYAQQLQLEVGSETGIIGLAGLLVFFVAFIRAGRGISSHPLAWAAWLGAFPGSSPSIPILRFIRRSGHC